MLLPAHDRPGAEPRVLLSEKGDDADTILADLDARRVAAIIQSKRNRKDKRAIDGHPHALGNLVERCFSKLKHSCRLAANYDNTADSYLGFIFVPLTHL